MTFEPVAIDFFQKCFDILRASHEKIRLENIPPENILSLPYANIGYESFWKAEEIYQLGREEAEKKWGDVF